MTRSAVEETNRRVMHLHVTRRHMTGDLMTSDQRMTMAEALQPQMIRLTSIGATGHNLKGSDSFLLHFFYYGTSKIQYEQLECKQ